MHDEYKTCIDECQKCAVECEHCATACLHEPDVGARTRCIQELRDCADICTLAVQYMARGSSHAKALCDLCATICDSCATECGKFRDTHCQSCATACRRCADECRKMAAKTAV